MRHLFRLRKRWLIAMLVSASFLASVGLWADDHKKHHSDKKSVSGVFPAGGRSGPAIELPTTFPAGGRSGPAIELPTTFPAGGRSGPVVDKSAANFRAGGGSGPLVDKRVPGNSSFGSIRALFVNTKQCDNTQKFIQPNPIMIETVFDVGITMGDTDTYKFTILLKSVLEKNKSNDALFTQDHQITGDDKKQVDKSFPVDIKYTATKAHEGMHQVTASIDVENVTKKGQKTPLALKTCLYEITQ